MTTLDNFSGPLDFLLYLMNRDMIPIRDVYVSKVTEQFVAYVQNLTDYDMGKVTEYLNLAADIIKLKLLTLVPNNPVAADDGDYDFPPEDDDPIDLKNALYEEYLRIKKREEKLKDRETTGFFYKRPDRDVGTRQTVFSLDGITQEALGKAMAQIMLNLEVKQHEDDSREIPRDEHTVAQKIVFIRELFEDHTREYDFVGLFTHDSTRGEGRSQPVKGFPDEMADGRRRRRQSGVLLSDAGLQAAGDDLFRRVSAAGGRSDRHDRGV